MSTEKRNYTDAVHAIEEANVSVKHLLNRIKEVEINESKQIYPDKSSLEMWALYLEDQITIIENFFLPHEKI